MRLEQLKCLADIAQTGSITGTAQRLFVTQQAVSKSIKQLETELGVEILLRSNAGVSVTEIGQEVVAFAQKVLAEEHSLQDKILAHRRQQKQTDEIPMDICSTSCVVNMVLPNIISSWNAQKKHVAFRINMTDRLDIVLETVQDGKSHLGLVSVNERELERKFSAVQDELCYVLLARDEMVAVMDKRFYKGDLDYMTMEEYSRHPKTLYNIVPMEEMRCGVADATIVCSSDADFHRSMLEKTGAIVLMSGLARQHFFNSKKYIALSLEHVDMNLLHVAIYRKDAGRQVKELVQMIRREMHIK